MQLSWLTGFHCIILNLTLRHFHDSIFKVMPTIMILGITDVRPQLDQIFVSALIRIGISSYTSRCRQEWAVLDIWIPQQVWCRLIWCFSLPATNPQRADMAPSVCLLDWHGQLASGCDSWWCGLCCRCCSGWTCWWWCCVLWWTGRTSFTTLCLLYPTGSSSSTCPWRYGPTLHRHRLKVSLPVLSSFLPPCISGAVLITPNLMICFRFGISKYNGSLTPLAGPTMGISGQMCPCAPCLSPHGCFGRGKASPTASILYCNAIAISPEQEKGWKYLMYSTCSKL